MPIIDSTDLNRKNYPASMLFLLITSFVCGAAIMLIEVLGSRVLGPFFGSSLYVWTAIISVTMLALALGYAAGGLFTDSKDNADHLYYIILMAGVFTLLIPFAKKPVLKFFMPMGLRLGSLLSATILFGPALFLLGAVSPSIIKLVNNRMKGVGSAVGSIYAVSTIGSLLGAIVTGFVLISHFGVNLILIFTGSLLIALFVIYFTVFKKKYLTMGLLSLPFVLNLILQNKVKSTWQKIDGTRIEIVEKKQSFYGEVKVIDYKYNARHIREIMIDGLIQGGIDMTNGLTYYNYYYLLQWIPYMLVPNGEKCLVMGVGTGVVPEWYESNGIITDVVDIDPNVIEMAKKYFNFSIKGNIHVEDARYFLSRSEEKYDYIILDVFTGDGTPSHLLSVENFKLIKDRMTDKSVLAINFMGGVESHNIVTKSVVGTISSLFTNVDLYPVFDFSQQQSGNIVIVAYEGKQKFLETKDVISKKIHPEAIKGVMRAIKHRFVFGNTLRNHFLITDDFNPVDLYDSIIHERSRKNILMSTDWDILFGSTNQNDLSKEQECLRG